MTQTFLCLSDLLETRGSGLVTAQRTSQRRGNERSSWSTWERVCVRARLWVCVCVCAP